MDTKQIEFAKLANRLVNTNMKIKKGEEVLIVVDGNTDMRLAYELAAAIEIAGGEFTLSMMPIRDKNNATRTTNIIAKSAEAADVIISLTRYNSCAVFDARVSKLVLDGKIRDVTLSVRDPNSFLEGGALADYEKVLADGIKIKEEMTGKKKFRITSPLGTDVSGEIGEGNIMLGCGMARVIGESMAFPDGEVSCTPNKNTVNGVIYADGPIQGLRQPTSPIKLTIKNSRVISLEGEDTALVNELNSMLKDIKDMDYLAEIAIGINRDCLRNGNFVEEKKAYGNLHIALGDNIYFGGDIQSNIHMDMVLTGASIAIDDVDFVRDGDVVILK